MTPESAGFNFPALPPLITGTASLVILIFGLVGAYLALRRKSLPDNSKDVPQWFYVRDLVHEIRNLRQIIEGMAITLHEIDQGMVKLLDRSDRNHTSE